MLIQVQDLLTDALALTGCIAIDEAPSASELATTLRVANMMIDGWASQRTLLRSTTPLSFSLVGGKHSYTIGAAPADVLLPKPISIKNAYIVDQQNITIPIQIVDLFTYNGFEDKIVATGQPIAIAYDPGAAQQAANVGTIFVYYNPDTVYTMNIEADTYLAEFVNLSDTVTFEPAYYEALVYNLAVRVFRFFRDPTIAVPAEVQRIARDSYDNLRTMNSVQMIASMELPGKISNYNIYTDGVR